MAEVIVAEYDCTTSELYSISETIIDNLEDNLAAFADYKSKYDADFVEMLRSLRTGAMDMLDEEGRNEIFKTKRIELIPLGKECCRNFQKLKGYIDDGFEESLHKTKYDAAGQTVYEGAAEKNWENVVTMNGEMITFIANNEEALTAGFMPSTFKAKVETASGVFDDKYGEFKLARQTGVLTTNKLNANNTLFGAIGAVNEDATRIFEDEAHLKLFNFSAVKFLVSPPGSASYKVKVLRETENTAVEGATVTIQKAGAPAIVKVTNAEGIAEFKDIDPAAYNVTIVATGLQTENFKKDVNTGTAARSEVFMDAV